MTGGAGHAESGAPRSAIPAALQALAGLFGAAGVALAALASHAGGTNTALAAQFLLFHAPALLAASLAAHDRRLALPALLMALGVALFCGDLLAREHLWGRLFPLAAPAGGLAMIAGWAGVAFTAVLARR